MRRRRRVENPAVATVGVVEAKAAAMEAVAEVVNMVAAARAVNVTGVAQLDGGRRLERPVRRKMPHICSRLLGGA